ncbi:MAG: pyruvate formate lyase II activase [Methanosaeta sp. PtaU1.Bin028]|nr:MAG: pyruvate formate lyase II activase [Methanosaeta sp. PtaU1.Bin028]
MSSAMFYQKGEEKSVLCGLCNHFCRIRPGQRGICGVRENRDGDLESLVYGKLIAAQLDPIEKKPLYHYLPGSLSYSVATVGCNFRCLHCQNSDISQLPRQNGPIVGKDTAPEEVVADALQVGAASISYTYTEPTIFFEFAYDTAVLAREAGLKNVFVSNGYMSEEALLTISPYLDAINVDLKGDDAFYKKVCKAKLEPVQRNIRQFVGLGVWTEVTTLVIPGYNDSDAQLEEVAGFLAETSPDMPWHVSAFHPSYRLLDAPPTSPGTIERAVKIGRQAGLHYVYAGNVSNMGDDTNCPQCGQSLVQRSYFRVLRNSVSKGRCPICGRSIAGVWGD